MNEQRVISILNSYSFITTALQTIKRIEANEIWIGAGFLRNCIWDHLHGFTPEHSSNDVDVLLYDEHNTTLDFEQNIEMHLKQMQPEFNWSVKNQARIKQKYNQTANSIESALSHWPETATCIAARLNKHESIELIAPYGVNDLLNLTVQATPKIKREVYSDRLQQKQWQQRWPKLTVISVF